MTTRAASVESTSSSSSGSTASSSSTGGFSGSSSSSSSSGSSASRPSAPAGAAAPSRAASGAASPVHMSLNRELRFTHADSEFVPMPKLPKESYMDFIVRILYADRRGYPEGAYRTLDYLRAAVEMFVAEVRRESQRQEELCTRAGRQFVRFLWGNKGELAVCFACCCDMLKLLFDALDPSRTWPKWESFVNQFLLLLMAESGLPADRPGEDTYRTKYLDWQKGGTRYGGVQVAANVRFPSAQERRAKVERYLSTGDGYKIETVTVPNAAAAAAKSQAAPGAAQVPPAAAAPSVKTLPPRPLVPPLAGAASGPGPVRPPARVGLKGAAAPQPPAPPVCSKQMPGETRHLLWLSALAHVKGGDAAAAFPEHRLQAMPGLVRLCEMTQLPEEMLVIARVMRASSPAAQQLFEQMGGLVALRGFAQTLIAAEDAAGLVELVDCVLRMRLPRWSPATHRAWRTDTQSVVGPDLGWLRALRCIPPEQRAAWGTAVLVLEEKYLFSAARAQYEVRLKRPRDDAEAAAAARADLATMMAWGVPRVFTLMAPRLPLELRAPPLSSALEAQTVALLAEKRRYAAEQQESWESALRDCLQASGAPPLKALPLWYDPMSLLMARSAETD